MKTMAEKWERSMGGGKVGHVCLFKQLAGTQIGLPAWLS